MPNKCKSCRLCAYFSSFDAKAISENDGLCERTNEEVSPDNSCDQYYPHDKAVRS